MEMDSKESSPESENKMAERYYALEEDVSIFQYIHARTHDPDSGLVEKFRDDWHKKHFWMDYVRETGSSRSAMSLRKHFSTLIHKIHQFPLTVEQILDLHYSLSVPIHEKFIAKANRYASILLDDDRQILAFDMKPEEIVKNEEEDEKNAKKRAPGMIRKRTKEKVSLDLEKEKVTAKRSKFTDEEVCRMWKFILNKLEGPNGIVNKHLEFKPSSVKIWREFAEVGGWKRSAECYVQHFRRMSPESLQNSTLDLRTKADLLYGLNLPVHPDFLEIIKEKTMVKTDGNGCIVEYNSEDL